MQLKFSNSFLKMLVLDFIVHAWLQVQQVLISKRWCSRSPSVGMRSCCSVLARLGTVRLLMFVTWIEMNWCFIVAFCSFLIAYKAELIFTFLEGWSLSIQPLYILTQFFYCVLNLTHLFEVLCIFWKVLFQYYALQKYSSSLPCLFPSLLSFDGLVVVFMSPPPPQSVGLRCIEFERLLFGSCNFKLLVTSSWQFVTLWPYLMHPALNFVPSYVSVVTSHLCSLSVSSSSLYFLIFLCHCVHIYKFK